MKSYVTQKLIILLIAFISVKGFGSSVYDLKCNLQSEPMGITDTAPCFSWKIHADKRMYKQTAYRILVSTDSSLLIRHRGNLWDSGYIKSDQSVWITYQGKPLEAGRTYYWSVRIKGNDGHYSDWSQPQRFTTGLFNEGDWHNAQWIALEHDRKTLIPAIPAPDDQRILHGQPIGRYKLPLLRKTFRPHGEVRQALAFVSGVGHFEMFINGQKVGQHFLDPGWSKYDKEILYLTFDITTLLKANSNVIGIMLGNGFYNIPNERYYKLTGSYGAPKALVCIQLKYADGHTEYIVSDSSWKTLDGPITYSSIFGGEDFDATRIPDGWLCDTYDDSKWQNAICSPIRCKLRSQINNSLIIRQSLPVVTRFKNAKGNWVYDLGQNASGIIRISVRGQKGQSIILRPAELLNDDRSADQRASGSLYYFKYTLGSDQTETWQPQFSYYGFRYIEAESAVPEGEDNPLQLPKIITLEGLHTSNEAQENGTFHCSQPLFNKIYELIDWAMRSNMASVLTDCPHREKLGWQEEAHLMQYSLQYRYDMSSIYPKILNDLHTAQLPNGTIPTIAPEFVRFSGGFEDTPEWGSSFIISNWYLYQWYGDTRLIKELYPDMKRYLYYLKSRSKGHIIAYGLGDWYDIGPNPPGYAQLTSNGVTATAIYYYDTILMRNMAQLLGKTDDVSELTTLADSIKTAYNQTFYHPDKGFYDRNSQTANAISLYLGLTDSSEVPRVLNSLVKDIRQRHNALTAGDIGYRFVLRALERYGRTDVIYDMNSRYDVPGYGWQLAHGATALTESWQAYGSVSNNHFMLGHLMEWLFSGVGGIRQSDSSIAFNDILIAPQIAGQINAARTSYESVYGRIACEWNISDKQYNLTVEIPANTMATVIIPCNNIQLITDYGTPICQKKEIQVLSTTRQETRLRIGSGHYKFAVRPF